MLWKSNYIVMFNKIFRGITNSYTFDFISFLLSCLIIILSSFNSNELEESFGLLIGMIILVGLLVGSVLFKTGYSIWNFKKHNWSIKNARENFVLKNNDILNLNSKNFVFDTFQLIFFFGTMILLIYVDADTRKIIGQILIVIAILSVIFFVIYTTGVNSQERERAQMVMENMRQIMEADSEKNRAAVAELFHRQFEAADRFAAMQYECSDERRLAANYGREAVKIVKSLAPDSAELAKLEDYINRQRDNLMQRLDEAFSQLSSTERLIFMYSVIGLSPRAISVLLNTKIENFYNHKSRLKSKLKSGSGDFVEVF